MEKYGLIGKILEHSFSKKYFTDFFHKNNIAATYDLIELENAVLIKSFVDSNSFIGFNVTTPYKEDILQYLDKLDPLAQKIAAVNCVKKEGNKWVGYNTDYYGLLSSFKRLIGNRIVENAMILGNGASTKTIKSVCEQLDINTLVVSRKNTEEVISYKKLNEVKLEDYPLIINASTVGMFPNINDVLPFPFQKLSSNHLLFDLIYNPSETIFLQKGLEKGAKVMNGLEMLIAQAEKSWEIWTNDKKI